jgi:hypothetical protein
MIRIKSASPAGSGLVESTATLKNQGISCGVEFCPSLAVLGLAVGKCPQRSKNN